MMFRFQLSSKWRNAEISYIKSHISCTRSCHTASLLFAKETRRASWQEKLLRRFRGTITCEDSRTIKRMTFWSMNIGLTGICTSKVALYFALLWKYITEEINKRQLLEKIHDRKICMKRGIQRKFQSERVETPGERNFICALFSFVHASHFPFIIGIGRKLYVNRGQSTCCSTKWIDR